MKGKSSLEIRWSDPGMFGSLAIAFSLLAFFVWASLAPMSGAIVATGLVKTEQNRKAIQHSEGGILKSILVRDGDIVKDGQPLIELDNISTDSNYQLFKELVAFETLKRDRLDAEQQLASKYGLSPQTTAAYGAELVDAAYQREHKIFTARRASLDQHIATLTEQLRAIELEQRALRAQVKADMDGLRLVEEELAMNRSLESQKFISRARLLTYERAISDYQSKLGEHEADLAQSNQRSNDIKLRMASLRNDYQRVATEEYKESNSRLVELRERLRPIEDALQRKVIQAPVSGKIVGLRFHTPGQVAGPREVLMEIVPNEENLILEAQVSVDGIKDLHVGQRADIRFTAFKSRTTPTVSGRVAYVSADALSDRNGVPFYQVHIQPDSQSLKEAGISQLQPGMAAELFILTEARTAFDYLVSPITDTLRKSMREK